MKTTAIVGAAFGDEGKGLTTDYVVNEYLSQGLTNGVVIRFNGGAQAGHTVVTPEGKSHIFHHFGSGTFLDVPTYLSRYFVCNPIIFLQEHAELSAMGFYPTVYLDSRCVMTTPYDMMVNSIKEIFRGKARHGSCGLGFGETIGRKETENSDLNLTYRDLYACTATELIAKLTNIREYYRDFLLGIASKSTSKTIDEMISQYFTRSIFNRFLEDCSNFHELVLDKHPEDHLDFAVFEGAQGLMLDMDHPNFPYVTRSNTGVTNVLRLCKDMDMPLDEVIYVSRTYVTRHGAGPLPNEGMIDTTNLPDLTNVKNMYQGKLRYAPFDEATLNANIAHDSFNLGADTLVSRMLTCCDQMEAETTIQPQYKSYGRTRQTVKVM